MNDKLLLRINEAGDRLGVSRAMVYALIGKGELRTVHIGSAIRIPAEALTEFVRRREAEAVEA